MFLCVFENSLHDAFDFARGNDNLRMNSTIAKYVTQNHWNRRMTNGNIKPALFAFRLHQPQSARTFDEVHKAWIAYFESNGFRLLRISMTELFYHFNRSNAIVCWLSQWNLFELQSIFTSHSLCCRALCVRWALCLVIFILSSLLFD